MELSDPAGAAALAAGAVAVIALVLAVVVDAGLDVADGDRIASGVRVGGVPVGGLGARSAHERLERRLGAAVREPLQLQAGGRSWTLSLSRGEASVDASAAVRAALDRSHDGAFPRRVGRALPGGGLDVDLAPPVAFRRGTFDRFIDRVARALERAPLDATVRSAGAQLRPVPDRPGTAVPKGTLEALVRAHIASTVARRTLSVPRRVQHANVRVSNLRTKYRHYVLIRRDTFRLEYFRGMRLARSYPIAVGMEGLDTPAGLYEIQGKQINPPWLVPNSPWAGDKAGKLIPPGRDNPLKARWLGFNGSAGIHGTSDVGSLGQRASHGCVRMSVPGVIDLYRRVPVHAPVRVE